jgi:hypothetical protein
VRISERFIDVRFRHDYYQDGSCPDLRVAPTTATLALLDARRLRFSPRLDGFSLIGPVEVDGAGHAQPRFPLEPGDRLVFGLALASPDFVYFTDLPMEEGGGRRYLLRNRQGTSRLTADLAAGSIDRVRLAGRQFSVRVPRTAISSSVAVDDETGARLAVAKVPPFRGDESEVTFSLGEFSGLAQVRDGDNFLVETVFVDADLVRMGVFGALELRPLDGSWPPQRVENGKRTVDTLAFSVDFRRRATRWRYHVVTQKDRADVDTLTIQYPADVREPYPPGVTFARAYFPEIGALFPGKAVMSFESDLAIPFYEEALRNVRLETPRATLLVNLPNAFRNDLKRANTSPSQPVSDIFISL